MFTSSHSLFSLTCRFFRDFLLIILIVDDWGCDDVHLRLISNWPSAALKSISCWQSSPAGFQVDSNERKRAKINIAQSHYITTTMMTLEKTEKMNLNLLLVSWRCAMWGSSLWRHIHSFTASILSLLWLESQQIVESSRRVNAAAKFASSQHRMKFVGYRGEDQCSKWTNILKMKYIKYPVEIIAIDIDHMRECK